MRKFTVISLLILSFALSACAMPTNSSPADGDENTEAESVLQGTEESVPPETEAQTFAQTDRVIETAPADFVPFASEHEVIENDLGGFSYSVVKGELSRSGEILLKITMTRKETAAEHEYNGSTSGSQPNFWFVHVDADGNRTEVLPVWVETDDVIHRVFLPGQVIEETVGTWIPEDAPSGYYNIVISHCATGSVEFEKVFFLE